MSDIDAFRNRLESRIATARKESHWSADESNDYMVSLAPKRARFEKLVAHWIESIIRPRVTLLANHFGAQPTDKAPPERCSCWFHYNERFPATTKVEFAVGHDVRFENVVVTCEMSMMPVFIKFNEKDRLTLSLNDINDEKVEAWTEKRLIEFLDIYLQIDRGEQDFDEDVATDPVCGMRISRSQAVAKADHNGHGYFFCSQECEQAFREHPQRFVRVAMM